MEGLDIITPIYNLLEYSDNYLTPGSLWNHYRDEVNDDANENNDAVNYRINIKKEKSKYFEYKTKITGNIQAVNNRLDGEVLVPLKNLSNFWRSLDLPLVKWEIELDLSWLRNCIISEISRTP